MHVNEVDDKWVKCVQYPPMSNLAATSFNPGGEILRLIGELPSPNPVPDTSNARWLLLSTDEYDMGTAVIVISFITIGTDTFKFTEFVDVTFCKFPIPTT